MSDIFDRLFWHPTILARHRGAPLVTERLAYLQRLVDEGAANNSLRRAEHYIIAVTERLQLAHSARKVGIAEIRRQAERWESRSGRRLGPWRWSSRAVFFRYATRWLRFLGRLEIEPKRRVPNQELLCTYLDELREDRGLSSTTIEHRRWSLERFLIDLAAARVSLRHIRLGTIDRVLLKHIARHGYGRESVKLLACDLRGFFAFLERRGTCAPGVAAGIKGPPIYSQARLPIGPTWDEVQRLIALTATDLPTDIRDRAILLLLAMYGLRSGEVRHMQLEDLDWRRELLFVRRAKSRARQAYPLVPIVGNAILRYLKEVRPRSSHREVFLLTRAPFGPLRSGIWRIVARRLRTMGLELSSYGSHSLRHACATHLLAEGFTLKEIGDHLGHRLPDTTRVYAKVDMPGLREIAAFDVRGLL